MKWILRLWRRWFGQSAAKPVKPRAQKRKETGAHYYLSDLLQELDECFRHLPKLRKSDPEAYKMYGRVGATVLSKRLLLSSVVEPHIAQNMPSFGCAFFSNRHRLEKKFLTLRFGYIIKETRPINVQVSNGTVYRVGLTYVLKGQPYAIWYHVGVMDGQVVPLKTCYPRTHRFGQKRKRGGYIVRLEWGFPEILHEWAENLDMTVEDVAVGNFAWIANAAYTREGGLTVSVNKGKERAVFGIDMERTPYFFADRDKTVNENGQTKKIIHIVRGHYRTLAGGQRKFIKSHFRGLRRFTWNGYQVRVGLAGWHGSALSEFDAATVDPVDVDREKTIGLDEVAEALDEVVA